MQNINLSTLNALKTEVLRKKEVAEKTKRTIENHQIRPLPKVSKDDSASSGDSTVNKIPELTDEEKEKAKKSRDILEAKAKLYESLSGGAHLLKGSGLYLVNFEQKVTEEGRVLNPSIVVDALDKNVTKDTDGGSSSEIKLESANEKARDLRNVSDKELLKEARNIFNSGNLEKNEPESSKKFETELTSADMQREKMRQKWEEDERLAQSKSDVHYQDILYDEVRSHGVGYFAFSKDEDERKRQQAELEEIRKETLKQQEEFKKKQGDSSNNECNIETTPVENHESQEVKKELTEEELSKKIEEALKAIRREVHVREWDKGKEVPVMSQEEWVEKKRNERDTDFAPPQAYFENQVRVRKRQKPVLVHKKPLFQKKQSTGIQLKDEETASAEERRMQEENSNESVKNSFISQTHSVPVSPVDLAKSDSFVVHESSSNVSSNNKVAVESRLKMGIVSNEVITRRKLNNEPPKSAMAMLEDLRNVSADSSALNNEIIRPSQTKRENVSTEVTGTTSITSQLCNPPPVPNVNSQKPYFVPFCLIPKKVNSKIKVDTKESADIFSNRSGTHSAVLPAAKNVSINLKDNSTIRKNVSDPVEDNNMNSSNLSFSESNKTVNKMNTSTSVLSDQSLQNTTDSVSSISSTDSSTNTKVCFKLGNLIRNRPPPKTGMALLEEIKKSTRDFGLNKDLFRDKPITGKRRVEIAPPECLMNDTPCLPVKKKGLFSKKEEVADSISVGLQNLKNVAEKKKKVREKGLLDIL